MTDKLNFTTFHVRLNLYKYFPATDDLTNELVYDTLEHNNIMRTKEYIYDILLNAKVLDATFQLEEGSNKKKHWQMTVTFATPINKYKAANLLKINRKVHEYCEPVRNIYGSVRYCMKDESRVDGPFRFPDLKTSRNILDYMLVKVHPEFKRTKKI